MVAQKKGLRKPHGGIELQKEFDTLAFTDYNQLVNARGAKAESPIRRRPLLPDPANTGVGMQKPKRFSISVKWT